MNDSLRQGLNWLVSNESLPWRVAAGLMVFALLAVVDLRRNGRRATRWREYRFLLACVAVAIVYGITNDLITSRISPEYFLFFKGAADHVSVEAAAKPAQHRGELDLQAIRIGTLATWTAGLIAGALLLTANSIGRSPPLPLRQLARFVPLMFVLAIALAILLGILGAHDRLAWIRESFDESSLRPRRLMCVYGIHLGGYVGALIGLAWSVARVLRTRIIRERKSRLPAV